MRKLRMRTWEKVKNLFECGASEIILDVQDPWFSKCEDSYHKTHAGAVDKFCLQFNHLISLKILQHLQSAQIINKPVTTAQFI